MGNFTVFSSENPFKPTNSNNRPFQVYFRAHRPSLRSFPVKTPLIAHHAPCLVPKICRHFPSIMNQPNYPFINTGPFSFFGLSWPDLVSSFPDPSIIPWVSESAYLNDDGHIFPCEYCRLCSIAEQHPHVSHSLNGFLFLGDFIDTTAWAKRDNNGREVSFGTYQPYCVLPLVKKVRCD